MPALCPNGFTIWLRNGRFRVITKSSRPQWGCVSANRQRAHFCRSVCLAIRESCHPDLVMSVIGGRLANRFDLASSLRKIMLPARNHRDAPRQTDEQRPKSLQRTRHIGTFWRQFTSAAAAAAVADDDVPAHARITSRPGFIRSVHSPLGKSERFSSAYVAAS